MNIIRVDLINKYLIEYSSINNKISVSELMKYLYNQGINVSRNTVKADINLLIDLGIKIKEETIKSGAKGFYIESSFSNEECRIILDSLGANKFIKENVRKEIRDKILKTVPYEDRKRLKYITKTRSIDTNEVNTSINISHLHKAITEKRYISFNTLKRNIDKKLKIKDFKDNIIPKEIYYTNERYYLIAINDEDNIRHFRIDRITNVMLNEKHNNTKKVNLDNYDIINMDMFSSDKVERVEFKVKNFLLDSIIERFGEAARIYKYDDIHFRLIINLGINKGLIRWILKQGSDIQVLEPQRLIDEVKEEVRKILNSYE